MAEKTLQHEKHPLSNRHRRGGFFVPNRNENTGGDLTDYASKQEKDPLKPTHQLTKDVLYYIDGTPTLLRRGEYIKVFYSLSGAAGAAEYAGKWDANAKWAAKKCVEKGLLLAWILGDVRGISENSVTYITKKIET